MIYNFTVPGAPIGKARPRITSKGAYTPKETMMYENLVRHGYRLNRQLHGELRAEIIAYYPIAKSTSNKKRIQMIDEIIRPTKKPDIDNIVKSILDSLNNIAFHDDSQIVELVAKKYYSEQPRVEVVLEELEKVHVQERLGE